MAQTILIVDDVETIRTVVSLQLKRLGFYSETAADGAEAILKAQEKEYALILMDIQMPNKDGLEATRAIREIEKSKQSRRVPIVALTANPDKERCIASGMDDYLFKPVMLDDLQLVLDYWLTIAALQS